MNRNPPLRKPEQLKMQRWPTQPKSRHRCLNIPPTTTIFDTHDVDQVLIFQALEAGGGHAFRNPSFGVN
jgi:hypothetical protein